MEAKVTIPALLEMRHGTPDRPCQEAPAALFS